MSKILYLTDDRSEYGMGYYYEDWLLAFKNKFTSVTVFGPGYSTKICEIPDDIDLVVYGHAFMDVYLQKKFRLFGHKTFHKLDLAKYKKLPSLLFSKNEYKLMDQRIEFASTLENCLLVCYCRQTLEMYESSYNNIIWAPFGINPDRFKSLLVARDIDVGMRGNRHGSYIGELRSGVADSLAKIDYLNNDIKLSENGEDFLFGDDYVTWLNRCKLVGNTKSAMDIVNPKFLETMACGAIPVCPTDPYEKMLIKDLHYIDYKDVIALSSKEEFDDFYQEKATEMSNSILQMTQILQYQNMLDVIIAKLSGSHNSSFVFEQFR